MKRFIFLFSLLLVFLTGCSTRSTSEIFYTISSTLPSDITLREDSETEYAMLNQSQTAFGGISLTDLSPSDINKGSSKMTLYYDTVLPGCQIGGWRGGRFLHRIWYNTLSYSSTIRMSTICGLIYLKLNLIKLKAFAPSLKIYNYTGGWTHIPLNNGYYTGLDLLNLSSVTIEINEKTLPLEEALQGGYITIDEIIARARLDASQGVCNEVAKSKNGLTRFYYHYSDFSIWYVYDIYETPDGKAHLIKVVRLYGALSSPGTIDLWDSNGNPIDYEDWGLTFTIVQQDAEGLTLRCTQSGGQQLGQLKVGISWLEAKKGDPKGVVP